MSKKQLDLAFQQTYYALERFKETVDQPIDPRRIVIDAAIHRFEFTVELFWKLLKRILASKGVDVVYPKEVLQAAYQGKLIDNEQIWLHMLYDRNRTSHIYNEKMADEIYNNLQSYQQIMQKTLAKLSKIQQQ